MSPFAHRARLDVKIERPARERPLAARRDRLVRGERPVELQERELRFEPGFQGGTRDRRKDLFQLGAARRVESRESPVERRMRENRGLGKLTTKIGVPADVIEMPVGVEDRARGGAGVGEKPEDLVGVLTAPARVDHDPAVGSPEEDGVSIRTAVLGKLSGKEDDARSDVHSRDEKHCQRQNLHRTLLQ